MFKLLLITAHPSPVSFNFALRHAAVARIAAGGGETLTSDLFQMGFGSLAGEGDFNNYDSALPMDLMEAQKNAPRHGGFVPQILAEQEKLVAADAVMLQFPIWWGSYPAPLKGWIDRVLSYGFAYGRSKTLPDKKVLYSVTTGGVSGPEEVAEYHRRVDALAEDVFGYLRWEILPPFFAHDPDARSAEQRNTLIREFQDHLAQHFGI